MVSNIHCTRQSALVITVGVCSEVFERKLTYPVTVVLSAFQKFEDQLKIEIYIHALLCIKSSFIWLTIFIFITIVKLITNGHLLINDKTSTCF